MARIITVVLMSGFALMFLVVGVTQFFRQRRNLQHAERVDAVIVHSTVRSSTSADPDSRLLRSTSTTSHVPDVRFRYRVRGEEYESEQLYPTIIGRGYASAESAAAVLRAFPVSAVVRAYVDPAHPERAFLIAERSNGPIVFMALGVLLPPLGWIVGAYV
jgi:hypothetical protein